VVNKEYDRLVRLQAGESDQKKRLQYIQEAQKIIADDYYIAQFGWGPAIIEAYNGADWEGVVQIRGFGVWTADLPWTALDATPKAARKRMTVGTPVLVKTTNIMGAGLRERPFFE